MTLCPSRGLLALCLALPCLAEEPPLPPRPMGPPVAAPLGLQGTIPLAEPPPLPRPAEPPALPRVAPSPRTRAPWTTQDTLWELSYVAVVAMDCSQSRQIEDGGRYERNPLLPRYPSARTITQLCVLNVAAHAAISYFLPTPWRRRWQAVTLVLEAAVVADNYYRAGVKLKF